MNRPTEQLAAVIELIRRCAAERTTWIEPGLSATVYGAPLRAKVGLFLNVFYLVRDSDGAIEIDQLHTRDRDFERALHMARKLPPQLSEGPQQ